MTRHHIPNIANAVAATLDAVQPRAIDDARLGHRVAPESTADERFAEAAATLVDAIFYVEPATPAIGGLQKLIEEWPVDPLYLSDTHHGDDWIICRSQPLEAVTYSVNRDAFMSHDGIVVTMEELIQSGGNAEDIIKAKRLQRTVI
jgi:hypothetical protein